MSASDAVASCALYYLAEECWPVSDGSHVYDVVAVTDMAFALFNSHL